MVLRFTGRWPFERRRHSLNPLPRGSCLANGRRVQHSALTLKTWEQIVEGLFKSSQWNRYRLTWSLANVTDVNWCSILYVQRPLRIDIQQKCPLQVRTVSWTVVIATVRWLVFVFLSLKNFVPQQVQPKPKCWARGAVQLSWIVLEWLLQPPVNQGEHPGLAFWQLYLRPKFQTDWKYQEFTERPPWIKSHPWKLLEV